MTYIKKVLLPGVMAGNCALKPASALRRPGRKFRMASAARECTLLLFHALSRCPFHCLPLHGADPPSHLDPHYCRCRHQGFRLQQTTQIGQRHHHPAAGVDQAAIQKSLIAGPQTMTGTTEFWGGEGVS